MLTCRSSRAVVGRQRPARRYGSVVVSEGGGADEALIREQIQFYRDAARYYGHVVGLTDEAFNDRVLAYCPTSAHCLELASGSGQWTMPLLGKCQRITAVDSSPERHTLSHAR